MSDEKKKRMSILDSLAAAGSPPLASSMNANRALRSARDAVDSHRVWELDPVDIIDERMADRLDPSDVADLRDAIEANGQAVPILVRRHPSVEGNYLLVYGRRRLEAIRSSGKVTKVRALVASLDDGAALKAQISENMARRDLSFIEKARFAQELVASGFGNQSQVAEVLTVTKSAVSMAIAIFEAVGPDLVSAIGPAHGIGRPRWEALAKAIEEAGARPEHLVEVAADVHERAQMAALGPEGLAEDPSVAAFEAVLKAAGKRPTLKAAPREVASTRRLSASGTTLGAIRRNAKGVTISLSDGEFAYWVEARAEDLIEELHARWQKRAED